jgi:hypothetical protein
MFPLEILSVGCWWNCSFRGCTMCTNKMELWLHSRTSLTIFLFHFLRLPWTLIHILSYMFSWNRCDTISITFYIVGTRSLWLPIFGCADGSIVFYNLYIFRLLGLIWWMMKARGKDSQPNTCLHLLNGLTNIIRHIHTMSITVMQIFTP